MLSQHEACGKYIHVKNSLPCSSIRCRWRTPDSACRIAVAPPHRRQVITRLCLLVSKFVPLTAQHAPRHTVLGEWASYQYRPPVYVSLLWLVKHPAAMPAHPTRGTLILPNRSMPNHTPSLDYYCTPIPAAGHPVRLGSCVGASDGLPPPAPPASPFRHALATSCAVGASP